MRFAERPRERLAAQGPAALTDAELVAVVLGTGVRGATALELARAALARHGGVSGLARVSHDLLLRLYLETDEAHELSDSFGNKRKPDPDKFGH